MNGMCSDDAGIELLSADDFATWYLSVEVLGNTVYEVRRSQYSLVPLYAKCGTTILLYRARSLP